MNYLPVLDYIKIVDYVRELNYQSFIFSYVVIYCIYMLVNRITTSEKKRSKTSPNKNLEEMVLKNNTIIDGLVLSVGKLIKQQTEINLSLDNIHDACSSLEEKVKNFHYDDYKQFYNKVIEELKILRDATFLPEEQDAD